MSEIADLSSYPFKFNPPLYPTERHHVPDLTETATVNRYRDSLDRIYDDNQSTFPNDADSNVFTGLRLGRIVQASEALTMAATEEGARYGFRFLYNPTKVRGGTNVGTDFIPDPSNTLSFVLQDGLETISFELLLNRMPEVIQGGKVGDYQHAITDEEFEQILERGTSYDLEYLYRIANGVHNLKSRSSTGDIGILLPNPCELFLGPFRSRGAIMSISATTVIFSEKMVPALTYVQLQFNRYLTVNAEGIEVIQSGGVGTTAGPQSNSSGASGSTRQGNPDQAPVPAATRESCTNPYGRPNSRYSAGYHTGEDYGAPEGSDILATRGGIVVFAGEGNRPGYGTAYGKHVVIQHASDEIYTLYAHMSSYSVQKGDVVAGGQRIGGVGHTGMTSSNWDHCHYEEMKPPYKYGYQRTPQWSNWLGDPPERNDL